ncbi:MAG: SGNH/GDSL hydrolase family protein [Gammaproteobacteria bacterium]|nr:SGNH/GDSL hydrolase family protein [Gammaproteobacteria bacterium]
MKPLLLTLLLLLAKVATAGPSGLYVFGDSLSDTGNFKLFLGDLYNANFDVYYNGRFSNGPIYADFLAETFGLSINPSLNNGSNYARGGATARDLDEQIDWFLRVSNNSAPQDGLYIVWIGGNDVRLIVDQQKEPESIVDTVSDLKNAIVQLHTTGARFILVPTIPDLGLAPYYREIDQTQSTLPDVATEISVELNLQVETMLKELALEGIDTIRVDTFDIMREINADPGVYGFTTTDLPCFSGSLLSTDSSTSEICEFPDEYLFWDTLHPTSKAHRIIADKMIEAIPEIQRLPQEKWFLGLDALELVLICLISTIFRRKQPPDLRSPLPHTTSGDC